MSPIHGQGGTVRCSSTSDRTRTKRLRRKIGETEGRVRQGREEVQRTGVTSIKMESWKCEREERWSQWKGGPQTFRVNIVCPETTLQVRHRGRVLRVGEAEVELEGIKEREEKGKRNIVDI